MRFESSIWRRYLLVAGFVALGWFACFRFPATWVVTGIGEANRPFMDLYNILAARDAARAGVNPYLPSDFDPYHRPLAYSDWWLVGNKWGLGRSDTLWVGTLLLGVVILAAVVTARPRTNREAIYLAALLVSPAFLLAANRSNNDLFVYLIVCLGLWCFRAERWPGKVLAVLLFAAAAVLKYTPLVTLVVLLDLRTRRSLLAALAVYGAVLLLGWPGVQTSAGYLSRFIPEPIGLYAFGAPMFTRNLALGGKLYWQIPAILLGAWAVWVALRNRVEPPRSREQRTGEREFMCGAAMLVGLFFIGSSYVYKLIFSLWLLPWLWELQQTGGTESRWSRWTAGLLLAVAWFEGLVAIGLNLLVTPATQAAALRALDVALGVSQVLSWCLMACLMRFLFIYLARRGWSFLRESAPVPSLEGKTDCLDRMVEKA